MVGRGAPKRKIEWAPITLAFNVLVVILASLMGYAYLNGQTSSRIAQLEHEVREIKAYLNRGRGND